MNKKTKKPLTKAIKLSDNLFDPKLYVAEIRIHSVPKRIEFAVQMVGRDEGKPPTWIEIKSVALARRQIKEMVSAYANGRLKAACVEFARQNPIDFKAVSQ